MEISIMTVTPDMARDWLHMNKGNRTLRTGLVRTLEEAIKRGEWKMTHQPIAIDKEGALLDGQHRLHAILQAGIACDCLVATNADRGTFDVIDIGVKRSIGDILHLSPDRASTLRFVSAMMNNFNGAITPQQAEKFWPIIRGPVEELLAVTATKRRNVTTAPIIAAAALRILGGANRNYIFDLWRNVVLLNFADLPPVGNAFLKQVLSADQSRKRAGERQSFARAWTVFDEDEKNRERLISGDPEDSITEAQATIITAMNMKIRPLVPVKSKAR